MVDCSSDNKKSSSDNYYQTFFYHLPLVSVCTEVMGNVWFLQTCVPTDGWMWSSVGTEVGASGFEPLASRTRTVIPVNQTGVLMGR